MGYNRYRHRSYSISKSKAKGYAEELEGLSNSFEELAKYGWGISTMLDSCYKRYDDFEIRLSNHSANNQYHDLNSDPLLINVKKSKLEFVNFIKNDLERLLKSLDNLDLEKYRFINVVDGRINCFFKNYKTKKDVVIWR